MADYLVQGNKIIYCKHGHPNSVPYQTTICKCPTCGCNTTVKFFGVVIDKNGDYVY